MKIKEVVMTLERFAPLPWQESYDNAGLQVGIPADEVSGVLLCLDVTEAVLKEAIAKNCNLVISHHPLLFRGLKRIEIGTLPERVVRLAIKNDIAIYSAHTNLDNAFHGVNFEIAQKIGLQNIESLGECSTPDSCNGLIGELPSPMDSKQFLQQLKDTFQVHTLQCNALLEHPITRIALCGGSGGFLLQTAITRGADCFITGEMGYHDFFGYDQIIQIAALGHYQSEQFTTTVMQRILLEAHPTLRILITSQSTNPIQYI